MNNVIELDIDSQVYANYLRINFYWIVTQLVIVIVRLYNNKNGIIEKKSFWYSLVKGYWLSLTNSWLSLTVMTWIEFFEKKVSKEIVDKSTIRIHHNPIYKTFIRSVVLMVLDQLLFSATTSISYILLLESYCLVIYWGYMVYYLYTQKIPAFLLLISIPNGIITTANSIIYWFSYDENGNFGNILKLRNSFIRILLVLNDFIYWISLTIRSFFPIEEYMIGGGKVIDKKNPSSNNTIRVYIYNNAEGNIIGNQVSYDVSTSLEREKNKKRGSSYNGTFTLKKSDVNFFEFGMIKVTPPLVYYISPTIYKKIIECWLPSAINELPLSKLIPQDIEGAEEFKSYIYKQKLLDHFSHKSDKTQKYSRILRDVIKLSYMVFFQNVTSSLDHLSNPLEYIYNATKIVVNEIIIKNPDPKIKDYFLNYIPKSNSFMGIQCFFFLILSKLKNSSNEYFNSSFLRKEEVLDLNFEAFSLFGDYKAEESAYNDMIRVLVIIKIFIYLELLANNEAIYDFSGESNKILKRVEEKEYFIKHIKNFVQYNTYIDFALLCEMIIRANFRAIYTNNIPLVNCYIKKSGSVEIKDKGYFYSYNQQEVTEIISLYQNSLVYNEFIKLCNMNEIISELKKMEYYNDLLITVVNKINTNYANNYLSILLNCRRFGKVDRLNKVDCFMGPIFSTGLVSNEQDDDTQTKAYKEHLSRVARNIFHLSKNDIGVFKLFTIEDVIKEEKLLDIILVESMMLNILRNYNGPTFNPNPTIKHIHNGRDIDKVLLYKTIADIFMSVASYLVESRERNILKYLLESINPLQEFNTISQLKSKIDKGGFSQDRELSTTHSIMSHMVNEATISSAEYLYSFGRSTNLTYEAILNSSSMDLMGNPPIDQISNLVNSYNKYVMGEAKVEKGVDIANILIWSHNLGLTSTTLVDVPPYEKKSILTLISNINTMFDQYDNYKESKSKTEENLYSNPITLSSMLQKAFDKKTNNSSKLKFVTTLKANPIDPGPTSKFATNPPKSTNECILLTKKELQMNSMDNFLFSAVRPVAPILNFILALKKSIFITSLDVPLKNYKIILKSWSDICRLTADYEIHRISNMLSNAIAEKCKIVIVKKSTYNVIFEEKDNMESIIRSILIQKTIFNFPGLPTDKMDNIVNTFTKDIVNIISFISVQYNETFGKVSKESIMSYCDNYIKANIPKCSAFNDIRVGWLNYNMVTDARILNINNISIFIKCIKENYYQLSHDIKIAIAKSNQSDGDETPMNWKNILDNCDKLYQEIIQILNGSYALLGSHSLSLFAAKNYNILFKFLPSESYVELYYLIYNNIRESGKDLSTPIVISNLYSTMEKIFGISMIDYMRSFDARIDSYYKIFSTQVMMAISYFIVDSDKDVALKSDIEELYSSLNRNYTNYNKAFNQFLETKTQDIEALKSMTSNFQPILMTIETLSDKIKNLGQSTLAINSKIIKNEKSKLKVIDENLVKLITEYSENMINNLAEVISDESAKVIGEESVKAIAKNSGKVIITETFLKFFKKYYSTEVVDKDSVKNITEYSTEAITKHSIDVIANYLTEDMADGLANVIKDSVKDIAKHLVKVIYEHSAKVIEGSGKFIDEDLTKLIDEDLTKLIDEDLTKLIDEDLTKLIDDGYLVKALTEYSIKAMAECSVNIIVEESIKSIIERSTKFIIEKSLADISRYSFDITIGKSLKNIAEDSAMAIRTDYLAKFNSWSQNGVISDFITEILTAECLTKILTECLTKVITEDLAKVIADNSVKAIADQSTKAINDYLTRVIAENSVKAIVEHSTMVNNILVTVKTYSIEMPILYRHLFVIASKGMDGTKLTVPFDLNNDTMDACPWYLKHFQMSYNICRYLMDWEYKSLSHYCREKHNFTTDSIYIDCRKVEDRAAEIMDPRCDLSNKNDYNFLRNWVFTNKEEGDYDFFENWKIDASKLNREEVANYHRFKNVLPLSMAVKLILGTFMSTINIMALIIEEIPAAYFTDLMILKNQTSNSIVINDEKFPVTVDCSLESPVQVIDSVWERPFFNVDIITWNTIRDHYMNSITPDDDQPKEQQSS